MYCISTKNLSYQYSKDDVVLNNINLQVPAGSIYGFLGPNGAGKTTTLRLILGLLKMQTGSIEVFNKSLEKNRLEILKQTGSLIESPSIYEQLTAIENLLVWQKIYQCPKTRIDEVLEITGLSGTGKKRAGKFSLGMKQRLSIAIALLHNPALIILDEPTNGLDPGGIIEIRELIRQLNNEFKITIVISSHLLAEIEKLVTDIGIINHGNLLFQGTLKELQAKQNQANATSFETSNPNRTIEIFTANGFSPVLAGGLVIIPVVEKMQLSKMNEQLINNSIDVCQIVTVKSDLESIFIDLVKPLP
jgi:ABC-type multidrug transport system ATPase subunit